MVEYLTNTIYTAIIENSSKDNRNINNIRIDI